MVEVGSIRHLSTSLSSLSATSVKEGLRLGSELQHDVMMLAHLQANGVRGMRSDTNLMGVLESPANYRLMQMLRNSVFLTK